MHHIKILATFLVISLLCVNACSEQDSTNNKRVIDDNDKQVSTLIDQGNSKVEQTNIASEQDVVERFQQLLHSYQGKVVYVDFWASWCNPCRKAFPWLNQMQAKYAEQGLVVLAVNLDFDQSLAQQFLEQYPADFTIFYDSSGQVGRNFKLKGMPTSLLFDRNSQLVSRHTGFKQEKQADYENKIKAALVKP